MEWTETSGLQQPDCAIEVIHRLATWNESFPRVAQYCRFFIIPVSNTTNNNWNVLLSFLYYTQISLSLSGQGDITRCFQCAGLLQHWRSTDEPFIEHALWFPHCVYVLMSRGKHSSAIVATCAGYAHSYKNKKTYLVDVHEAAANSANVCVCARACARLFSGKQDRSWWYRTLDMHSCIT